MSKIKIIFFILLVLLGVFLFIFGEYDDSPGGQMLGLIIIALDIIWLVRNRKKKK